MDDKIITLNNLKRYDVKIKSLIPSISYCSDDDVACLFGLQIPSNALEWSVQDLKSIAEDISSNGQDSSVYAAAKTAMDAGQTWTADLTDGTTLTYRIVGINHDDKVDGPGKAGLTFQATHSLAKAYRLNATKTNVGGWEASELRASMNSGEIWELLPADLQRSIAAVSKWTNNVRGGDVNKNATVTATSDKLFLLSYAEYVPTSYWASSYPGPLRKGRNTSTGLGRRRTT